MTYEDFDKLMGKMVGEELEVGKTKGMEYTQGDRLDNFKRIAKETGVSPKLILWVYLKKHLDSIASFIKKENAGQEMKLAEPIEGRIMDARVYLALLRGLIGEDKKGA
jgi:hypothetical protein